MALVITTEHLFKIIKILAFIGFVSLFLFFGVFEVWNKFSKGSTNFESTKKSVEKLTPPTFLLCFKPQHRRSILAKNNLTGSYFSFINQNPEESDFLGQDHVQVNCSLIVNCRPKVNCRIKFGLARPTVGRPAWISSYNSLLVYNSLVHDLALDVLRFVQILFKKV